jgi:hypothetical protein
VDQTDALLCMGTSGSNAGVDTSSGDTLAILQGSWLTTKLGAMGRTAISVTLPDVNEANMHTLRPTCRTSAACKITDRIDTLDRLANLGTGPFRISGWGDLTRAGLSRLALTAIRNFQM